MVFLQSPFLIISIVPVWIFLRASVRFLFFSIIIMLLGECDSKDQIYFTRSNGNGKCQAIEKALSIKDRKIDKSKIKQDLLFGRSENGGGSLFSQPKNPALSCNEPFTIVVLSPPFQSNAEWQKLSKMWPSVMEWDGEKLVFAIFL